MEGIWTHVPVFIPFFKNKPPIYDVAAGYTQTVVLLTNGDLYTFGDNEPFTSVVKLVHSRINL